MHIAMFTNTYLPLVGGASISVSRYARTLRSRGHQVLVVVPSYDDEPESEQGVHRTPALKRFRGTRFSVPLPLKLHLDDVLDDFRPGLIHAHHPFLMGDTALREAITRNLPVVVTHHTHMGQYIQFIPDEVQWLATYIHEICVGHANLCDAVIAPSTGVKDELLEAGVSQPIEVIPTGVDTAEYAKGNGAVFRERFEFPEDTLVLGYVGRLAPEKNLAFLSRCVAETLRRNPDMHFLVVGGGDNESEMRAIFEDNSLTGRVRFAGVQKGQDLVDAYHAMDLFVFASKSETQGMVLTEAMAAGTPVVALEARGVEDVVEDGHNGRMVRTEETGAFADAVCGARGQLDALAAGTRETARRFSLAVCTDKLAALYERLLREHGHTRSRDANTWETLVHRFEAEWVIWLNRASAIKEAFTEEEPEHT